jgi:hypothetical protein
LSALVVHPLRLQAHLREELLELLYLLLGGLHVPLEHLPELDVWTIRHSC